MWTEIVVSAGGAAPAARDGHTASVTGTKMIIFGGRGNGSDSGSQDGQGLRTTAFFDDEWEIDLDPSRHVTVATNSSTVSCTHVVLSSLLLGGLATCTVAVSPAGCSMGHARSVVSQVSAYPPGCTPGRVLPDRVRDFVRIYEIYDNIGSWRLLVDLASH